MHFKKISLLVITMLITFGLSAQIGKIQFEKTTHDFGNITEESRSATYNFEFTNTGEGDLKVLNVKTSCGCTASDYTRTPIKPGEKGQIKVTYSTTNRPGSFRKSITVSVNNPDNPNTVLFIKGFVTPKAKDKGANYPVTMGNLKLMSNHLAFNDILSTEIRIDTMRIFNNWHIPMEISFEQVPEHLKVVASPTKINSKGEGLIIVTYDGSKKKDFGLLYDRVAISTNDQVQPLKTLNVSARVNQDFSKLTEKQLKKAPKIVFNQLTYDFGEMKTGSVITYRFEFKNEGKSNLEILNIKTSCGCTTTELPVRSYKKNKGGAIEMKFDTSGRTGRQHKTITIITNDPQNSQIVLNVTGELK